MYHLILILIQKKEQNLERLNTVPKIAFVLRQHLILIFSVFSVSSVVRVTSSILGTCFITELYLQLLDSLLSSLLEQIYECIFGDSKLTSPLSLRELDWSESSFFSLLAVIDMISVMTTSVMCLLCDLA